MGVNWHTFFFLLMALLACGFALAVVFSNNIVRMAFYLILSLGAVSGLFFLAGADFVGAMQLMIYVGGTLVLLVFGVMLTARRPWVDLRTSGGQWVLAAIVGAALLAVLLQTAFSVPPWHPSEVAAHAPAPVAGPTAGPLGLAMVGLRVEQLAQGSGDAPRTGLAGYLLPFEIVSVHLVVVLVGAAYLARTRRKRRPRAPAQLKPEPDTPDTEEAQR